MFLDIDNAEGWDTTAKRLCEFYNLPDLSGLKKVHQDFQNIYDRLETAYQSGDNWKLKGGLVCIVAKLCADSLLCKKLFEKGILDLIMPMLDVKETRHVALRALNTIAHHGGVQTRGEIAVKAHHLTKLMRDHPDDDKISELGVIILSHCSWVTTGGDEALKLHNPVDVLETIVETIQRPHSYPRAMIEHAVVLFTATLHSSQAFKIYPPAVKFLVAGMRSKDWPTRCSCLGAIVQLDRLDAENDTQSFDPRKLVGSIQRGIPNHLNDILVNYGLTRSEIYSIISCTKEFQEAMMICAQDKDLYSLGLKLSALILKTEFSISEGDFMNEDSNGRPLMVDAGLPFKMFSESLPHAAEAIRAKGNPEEQDFADILDIKYYIMKQRIPDAVALSNKALQRNPQQAYFYYASTLSADYVLGLRAAKKGLKCQITTPFVKYQMMQRAVQHAGNIGLQILQDSNSGQKWEEGIAFLMSAMEDAKVYLDEAPPDNRRMENVGYWYVLLSILTREQLSPDLRELESNLKKLKVAEEFSKFLRDKPPNTFLRLAQRTVVGSYSDAINEFGDVYAKLDDVKVKDGPASTAFEKETTEDDLESWLEEMYLEDGGKAFGVRCEASETSRTIDFANVMLYRCSSCGNPSAALKKCGQCSKTRYCDSGCQKLHWVTHKQECSKAQG